MVSLRDEFHRRLDEFELAFGWEEHEEVVLQLTNTGEMIDLVFGAEEAALAMTALKHIIRKGRSDWTFADLAERSPDADWRNSWKEIYGADYNGFSVFLDELHDLNAFATLGILPLWRMAGDELLSHPDAQHLRDRMNDLQDVPAFIQRICAKIDRFIELVPQKNLADGTVSSLSQTHDRALARLKLDSHQPLTTHELAVLSGVSLKRLQNAIYAKTDEAPRPGKGGLISPEDCMVWLQSRDYFASIWKEIAGLYPLGEDWGENVEWLADEGNNAEADFCFIPVANDGSEFTPDLWRDASASDGSGGFTIGAKGQEAVVPDFADALAALQKMEVPRWRRPNPESGNWGIVTGQSWRRVQRASLEGSRT